jgi:Ca2+-binding EF-hand superfamily protein
MDKSSSANKTVMAVSEKELRRIHKRFKKLDRNNDDKISREEFLLIPELVCFSFPFHMRFLG